MAIRPPSGVFQSGRRSCSDGPTVPPSQSHQHERDTSPRSGQVRKLLASGTTSSSRPLDAPLRVKAQNVPVRRAELHTVLLESGTKDQNTVIKQVHQNQTPKAGKRPKTRNRAIGIRDGWMDGGTVSTFRGGPTGSTWTSSPAGRYLLTGTVSD